MYRFLILMKLQGGDLRKWVSFFVYRVFVSDQGPLLLLDFFVVGGLGLYLYVGCQAVFGSAAGQPGRVCTPIFYQKCGLFSTVES